MELFVDFQIPSDLLSYQGKTEASPDQKIEQVGNVIVTFIDLRSDRMYAKSSVLYKTKETKSFLKKTKKGRYRRKRLSS